MVDGAITLLVNQEKSMVSCSSTKAKRTQLSAYEFNLDYQSFYFRPSDYEGDAFGYVYVEIEEMRDFFLVEFNQFECYPLISEFN